MHGDWLDSLPEWNKFTYEYDANNNIKSIINKVNYTYDALNQLTQEAYIDGQQMDYTYDKVGNRLTKSVKNAGKTESTTYQYNDANQLSYVNNQEYLYDLDGNLTSDGKYTYEWNAFDQLTKVKNNAGNVIAEYGYDEKGRRIYSKNSNGPIYYAYDGDSNRVLYEKDKSSYAVKSYVYDDNGHPLTMIYKGETYHYLTNYRGDVLGMTNASGKLVASYTYDSWGNILTQSGIDDMDSINPYRYAGYRYDEDTKLYYLMARYYNPDTGVFLSLDPVSGDVMNPISMNGYNYANNNPVMNVDPDGEFAIANRLKPLLKYLIKVIFADFRENTLTNFALLVGGGGLSAIIARKMALRGFTMLNRAPNKKAIKAFIVGGFSAYISGSFITKTAGVVQYIGSKLWKYEAWFDRTSLGKIIDRGLLNAERYLLRKLR